jgi:hypothetical protein
MPHLQASEKGPTKEGEEQQVPLSTSSGETSKKHVNTGGNKLLSLAATASKHAPPAESLEPHSEGATYNNEGRGPPGGMGHQEHSNVTPSPYVSAPPHGYEHPPYYGYESHPPSWMGGNPAYGVTRPMGVYGAGARRLFPSPIRYNRTKGDDEDTNESKTSQMNPEERSPPRNSGYPFRGPPPPQHGRPQFYGHTSAHPYPGYPPPSYGFNDPYSRHATGEHAALSPMKKRSKPAPAEAPSTKRWKPAVEQESPKQEEKETDNRDNPKGLQSPPSAGGEAASSQRVISPSSSIEGGLNAIGKCHDEESASDVNDKAATSETVPTADEPRLQEHPEQARYPPQEPRYGGPHPGPYQHPYYPPGPPGPGMYGYPHPPSYSEGPSLHGGWKMPRSGSFPPPPQMHGAHPPYPPSYPPPYSHAPMPHHQQRYPPTGIHGGHDSSLHTMKGGDTNPSPVSSSTPNSPQQLGQGTGAPKIKSVAEWQRATLATGKAPSANRCMPLKAPIPSKYWGEAEKIKDSPIPDFHQLVNFPDYLNKMRPNGSEPPGSVSATNGKRPCVMCGKHRVCSASTANSNVILRRSKKQGEEDVTPVADDEDSSHIIPRQNKGLCTACDISVWVFVESGLEIKWCKGCKNFRPWAAFGDKGLATKCVRCRDRQREKYAIQKDDLRLRRLRQNKHDEKKEEEHHEIAAAKGLRDLMAASASI